MFSAMFLYVSFAEQGFEQHTRDFVISEVEKKVDIFIPPTVKNKALNSFQSRGAKISAQIRKKAVQNQQVLDAGIDVMIADILASACKLDCSKRENTRRIVKRTYQQSILRDGLAVQRLNKFVIGEYDIVMQKLKRDLKIFTGSNAIILFIALLLSIFRGRAASHLLPFSIILTFATIIMGTWYIFGQNWFMTIIYSEYWGWGYSAFLAIIASFLIDIALNRARITSHVMNGISNVSGAAANFVPC